MKVDFSANMNLYRKNNINSARTAALSYERSKQDVAEFSQGSTTLSDKSFVSLKAALQRELSYPTDSSELLKLSESIREGNYNISTNDLVKALLNG